MVLSARTHVVGVIGDPVIHSLSPLIHNAAFTAVGLDWVYVAFPTPAGAGESAVAAMRTLGIVGLSVTMPHKATVAGALDRLSPTAARLGVVNTVIRHEDELVGDSTDGPGFIDALRAEHGWTPRGQRCVVLGTGGAARAVCLALAESGAAAVTVVGRHEESAAACADLAGDVGSTGVIEAVADADLVVHATPVGMAGHGSTPALPFDVDVRLLGADQLVVDLIYSPEVTPLLAAAGAAGSATANGLAMLVHQAARQFAAWTGQGAPLADMEAAARRWSESRP